MELSTQPIMSPLPASQSPQQLININKKSTDHDIYSFNCRIAELKKCCDELKKIKPHLEMYASNSIKIKESTELAKLSIERGGKINLLKNSLSHLTDELKEKMEQVSIKRQFEIDIKKLYKDNLLKVFGIKRDILNNLNIDLHVSECKEPYYSWILKFKFGETNFLRAEYNFKEFKLLAMNPQPENFTKIQILLQQTNDITGLLYTFKKYLDYISSSNCENNDSIDTN